MNWKLSSCPSASVGPVLLSQRTRLPSGKERTPASHAARVTVQGIRLNERSQTPTAKHFMTPVPNRIGKVETAKVTEERSEVAEVKVVVG